MKVDNKLRNLLLGQIEFLPTSDTSGFYFGEKFEYNKVTNEEILETIKAAQNYVNEIIK